MREFLNQSVFFGVAISVLTYELGVFLKKKLKWPICNPLFNFDRRGDHFSGRV